MSDRVDCCFGDCRESPLWEIQIEDPNDPYSIFHSCDAHLNLMLSTSYINRVYLIPIYREGAKPSASIHPPATNQNAPQPPKKG